jgi:hypothetical protein
MDRETTNPNLNLYHKRHSEPAKETLHFDDKRACISKPRSSAQTTLTKKKSHQHPGSLQDYTDKDQGRM